MYHKIPGNKASVPVSPATPRQAIYTGYQVNQHDMLFMLNMDRCIFGHLALEHTCRSIPVIRSVALPGSAWYIQP